MLRNRILQKVASTNINTSAFAAIPPTITKPSGAGVLDLLHSQTGSAQGNISTPTTHNIPKRIFLMPYGLGSDNDAFDMKVTGWWRLGDDQSSTKQIWIPTALVVFSAIISGTAKGVAGSSLLATEFLADTLTIKTGGTTEPVITNNDFAGAAVQGRTIRYSPADDTPAWAIMELWGVELLQFQFDQTTNTPTMNCLYAMLDK